MTVGLKGALYALVVPLLTDEADQVSLTSTGSAVDILRGPCSLMMAPLLTSRVDQVSLMSTGSAIDVLKGCCALMVPLLTDEADQVR
jgi:hypothetical protein